MSTPDESCFFDTNDDVFPWLIDFLSMNLDTQGRSSPLNVISWNLFSSAFNPDKKNSCDALSRLQWPLTFIFHAQPPSLFLSFLFSLKVIPQSLSISLTCTNFLALPPPFCFPSPPFCSLFLSSRGFWEWIKIVFFRWWSLLVFASTETSRRFLVVILDSHLSRQSKIS